MKTLLLIRHAKSISTDHGMNDFERVLNERGEKDAVDMAKRLLKKNIGIDLFISSPAYRARTTCELFMHEFHIHSKHIDLKSELYLPDDLVFFDVIKQIDPSVHTAAVFSHNNGITDFANQLTEVKIDNMPTSSIYAIKIHSNKWSDFENAKKEFWFFDYPKRMV